MIRKPAARPALPAAALAAALCALLLAPAARADNVLGLYVSGALGQASVASDSWYQATALTNPSSFRENHSAWAARIGIKPLPMLGAEAEYYDLGNPSTSVAPDTTLTLNMKGTGLYGLVYLPIPLIDIYGKAGIARTRTTNTLSYTCTPAPGCTPLPTVSFDQRDNGFAYGAGVQFKLASLGVRAEYQRFSAAESHPGLATLGLVFEF